MIIIGARRLPCCGQRVRVTETHEQQPRHCRNCKRSFLPVLVPASTYLTDRIDDEVLRIVWQEKTRGDGA